MQPDTKALPVDSSAEQFSAHTVRRNIFWGTANSFFVEAGMTLTHPSMVLTLFIKELGGSNFLVGLLPSLRFFGWLAPQFVAAGVMQRYTKFIPVVRALEIIRSAFYLFIAALAFFYGRTNPQMVLVVSFVLFLITRFAAGSSAVARAEIVARMVPARERSTVVSLRNLAGGLAGFAAGFIVRYVLDERVSQFPNNYAILIAATGVAFVLATVVLNLVREPILAFKPKGIDVLAQLKRAPLLLKADRQYALYTGVKAASTGLELASPFYVLYATQVLGAPGHIAGVYIAVSTFSRILSNIFWGNQCKQRGNLWVVKAGCALGVVAPVIATLLPQAMALIWEQQIPSWGAYLFCAVFFIQGLATSADGIGGVSYLYDIAPEQDRPTYYGLVNTVLGPLYFLPALAGGLLDIVGFGPIFGAAAVAMALAYGLALKLGKGEDAKRCSAGAVAE